MCDTCMAVCVYVFNGRPLKNFFFNLFGGMHESRGRSTQGWRWRENVKQTP